jgi:putative oxidoreductase
MLARLLEPKTEAAYTFLRVVAGLMFSFHGMQKIFGVWTEHHTAFGGQIWIGGVIELVAGLLIAAGLFTRAAAFLASGTMAVAYIQFHWKFAFDRNFFPGVNDGEMALLYSVLFLFVACRGPGPYSVDRRGR